MRFAEFFGLFLIFRCGRIRLQSVGTECTTFFKFKDMMKQFDYAAPEIEVSEVYLESGIAASLRTEDYTEVEGQW